MKVSDLIEALKKMPQDKEVWVASRSKYDYGTFPVSMAEESPCMPGEPPTSRTEFETWSTDDQEEYTESMAVIWYSG
jgi:hypothetical protein